MEEQDKVAYRVLRNNYSVLCTDVDARRITTKASERGLLSTDEKKSVWQCVSRDGVCAGTERFLDLLIQNNQEGVFQLLVELLSQHGDLKFWADCLRDEYEAEKRKERESVAGSEATSSEEGTKARRLQLRRSLVLEEEALPNVNQELPEMTLLRQFSEAKGCPLEDVKGILSRYTGDLRTIHSAHKKSLLHLACEDMELRTVKYLVEELNFALNEQDSSGNTPLHIACLAQKVQSAMYLSIHPSCNPNIKNADGLTPLHIVTKSRHMMLVKHLLNVGNLDRTVTDSSGRTAVEIIREDPQLAPSLVKKTSTVSLTDAEHRPEQRVPGARKMSALPSLESYRSTTESTALLGGEHSTSVESETDLGRSQSPPYGLLTGTTNEGGEEGGMELNEFSKKNSEDSSVVVLRDKSKLRSLYQVEEGETDPTVTTCCCRRHRSQKLDVTQEKRSCDIIHCARLCGVFKVVFLLVVGIFIGLLVIGALAYFLATESQD